MSKPIVRRPPGAATAQLEAAGLSQVLARVYAARGIAAASELDHSFAALPPFTTMKGIDAAAQRLAPARDRVPQPHDGRAVPSGGRGR